VTAEGFPSWDVESQYDYFGARYYDARVGRFLGVDAFAHKYPSVSPFSYAANNPLFFVDRNGDSLLTVNITNTQGYIHGQTQVTIDHTYLQDLTRILQAAVDNCVHVHINSSFRTLATQNSDAIQQSGTTPAGDDSRHVAGFALDLNLYTDNDVSQGLLHHNTDQDADNNRFIRSIGEIGSRWGGSFQQPDPIHVDAGDDAGLLTRYGVDFSTVRTQNQTQYSGRGVTNSVNVDLLYPIRRLEPAPLNLVRRTVTQ